MTICNPPLYSSAHIRTSRATCTAGSPLFTRWLCLFALACLFTTSLPAFAAPQPPSTLEGFLQVKQRELNMLTNAEQDIAESVDQRLDTARSNYSLIRQQYEEALLAQGLSLASPIEERALSRQLSTLEKQLTKTNDILRDINDQAGIRLDRLSTINTRSDFSAQSSLSEEMQSFITAYLKQIMQMRARLDEQQDKSAHQLKQARSLLDKIHAKRSAKEEGLSDRWKEYFFRDNDPIFSLELWQQPGSIPLWMSVRLVSFKQELNLLSEKSFSAALLSLFIFATVASGGIPLLRAGLRNKEISPLLAAQLHRAGLIGTIGFALVATDMRIFGGAVPSFSVVSWFLLGYGVLMGSNTIRRVVLPDFNKISKAPISWLFLLAGAILVSEMPGKLVAPLWTGASLVFLAHMTHKHRKDPARSAVTLNVWFWMAILFTLLAMAGYGRFSSFLCMLWFVGYVAYGGSTGLMVTISKSMDNIPDEGGYVMLKGALMGIASPVIWSAAAALGGYWLYQFLGEGILRSVGELTVSWEGFSLKFASVLLLALLFYVTRACAHLAKGALDRMANRWPRGQRGTVLSLKTMSTYSLWFIYGLITLHVLGVSLTSLTVVAGGLSVGIGFGMQTIFNNFVSGLILLFGRSIQQGDIIQVGDLWCTVRTITIRSTVVETFDNASLIIPNSDLVTTQVTNWTKNNTTIRRDLSIGVAYGSDTELVRQTLLSVAEAHPNVLRRPQPNVLFNEFGASSLDFILRVWINDIDNSLATLSDLRFTIDTAFRKAAIEIAFPQMDLHIRTAPALQQLSMRQQTDKVMETTHGPLQKEPELEEHDSEE